MMLAPVPSIIVEPALSFKRRRLDTYQPDYLVNRCDATLSTPHLEEEPSFAPSHVATVEASEEDVVCFGMVRSFYDCRFCFRGSYCA
jgi:hypothetical protein